MTKRDSLNRRMFLKGAAVLAAALPLGAFLSACGAQPANEDSNVTGGEDGPNASPADPSSPSASTLVVYYSATGNTERVAQVISGHLGADVFELTPTDPYSDADLDYDDGSSRVSREHDNYERMVELVKTTPDGFEGYQTVFVGYPIWWGEAAWPINEFVVGSDFAGKTVIPFCTSASSPLGTSAEDLAAMAGAGKWQDGQRFASDVSDDEVVSWVDGLGL